MGGHTRDVQAEQLENSACRATEDGCFALENVTDEALPDVLLKIEISQVDVFLLLLFERFHHAVFCFPRGRLSVRFYCENLSDEGKDLVSDIPPDTFDFVVGHLKRIIKVGVLFSKHGSHFHSQLIGISPCLLEPSGEFDVVVKQSPISIQGHGEFLFTLFELGGAVVR
ncbi:hypothetical protein FOVG_03144 [Fusarium oxysporum f. sp. pisi HDV247]|uniref:Uncharacterized protein n=1 Tax=Fusarium oxysporum f. sp. pisi HDV247 TaxID=1080344 RepID=W9PYZ6_FUSOX|nr:hypothetical protein FOVG_03144 [Fusarium oxysporum f. sp. pisi HDV247]